MNADAPINVRSLIDDARLSLFQVRTILLCACVAFLDGYNTQSIGAAAPSIARTLQFHAVSLAPVFSAALLGAMFGALAFGPLADRFGRKRVLIVAVLLFAVFTLTTAMSASLDELLANRFLAGLGLGGATPCFIALTTEYAPARLRASLIAAMWAAFPIGGVVGGLINPDLIAALGWRSLFYLGSAVPVALALALALALPESLRYLVAVGAPAERVRRICRHLVPDLPHDCRFYAGDEPQAASIWSMLRSVPASTTLLLWVVFLAVFMILVFTPLWAPVLLVHRGGLSIRHAANVVALNNLGSAIGTVGFGRLFDMAGARGVLIALFVGGAFLTGGIGVSGASAAGANVCSFLGGMLLGGGSAGAIALAASIYPTRVRSTGIGWAMAMGRFGQVLGPFVAGALLAYELGARFIFPVIGAFALLAALCVWLLKYRHGPALPARQWRNPRWRNPRWNRI